MTSMDVSKAIEPKSDQINADNLITGPMTIKISDVSIHDGEQPVSIFFEGGNKPWKPCKTAMRCLASIWGPNAAQWIGLSCTIYNDPTVTWAGVAVGGIRVSHMEGLDKPRQLQLTKTRGKKGAVTIQPLAVKSAEPDNTEAYQKEAREFARKGKDSLQEWWKLNPEKRDAARTIMDELKALSTKEEAPLQEPDDDEIPL